MKIILTFLLLASLAPECARALPSDRLQPLLEPCLNAILAPLQNHPQMPRVKVETLRAKFAAGLVTASTPAEKQIYQNAMAVCDAMTSDMDARANAQAAAQAAAEAPTLSTGGDIVSSAPVHGWDAGADAQAIRGKQKDERAYADKQAGRQSAFIDSSAYTSWVKNAPSLRENVMNLFTRQVELEALYTKSNQPPPQAPAPVEATASAPGPADTQTTGNSGGASGSAGNVGFGTFINGKDQLIVKEDHTAVRIYQNGTKTQGTWTVTEDGQLHFKFKNNKAMTGDFSQDGKTFTNLHGEVFTRNG